jgi:glycine hydroxymethyltransferase
VLGGPLPHAMAAKAVALREALEPGFRGYAERIVVNSRALADELQRRGATVLTGGTDNHLVMVDVADSFGITGRQAESALRACHLTLNRNSLPFDANGAWYTSGLRLGTPAVTTLGMGPDEMAEIADVLVSVLKEVTPVTTAGDDGSSTVSKAKYNLPDTAADAARKRVGDLLSQYRLYPEIDLDVGAAGASG